MKNILIFLFMFVSLTGCFQGTAMFGSVFSVATTGSVQNAIISQGVNYSVKKSTGKNINEHITTSFKEEIRNCETEHSTELNKVFFKTLDELDCVTIK
tara:strand:- start:208 stop:501 length:294 start_codon:yes stop_codon:yes gene_type:complete